MDKLVSRWRKTHIPIVMMERSTVMFQMPAAARRKSASPSSVRSGPGAPSGGVHSTDDPAAISNRATAT
jgi:hypothetical protein